MAEQASTNTEQSYQNAGWKCAELIADMLDGQDRKMAFKIINQQKRLVETTDGSEETTY